MLVASLRAQLDPAHATGKASAMLHFNLDRAVNRCTDFATFSLKMWVLEETFVQLNKYM